MCVSCAKLEKNGVRNGFFRRGTSPCCRTIRKHRNATDATDAPDRLSVKMMRAASLFGGELAQLFIFFTVVASSYLCLNRLFGWVESMDTNGTKIWADRGFSMLCTRNHPFGRVFFCRKFACLRHRSYYMNAYRLCSPTIISVTIANWFLFLLSHSTRAAEISFWRFACWVFVLYSAFYFLISPTGINSDVEFATCLCLLQPTRPLQPAKWARPREKGRILGMGNRQLLPIATALCACLLLIHYIN